MSEKPIFKRVSDFVDWIGVGRILASSIGVLIVITGGWWIMRSPPPPIEASIAFAPAVASSAVSVGAAGTAIIPSTAAVAITKLTVHVAGEVMHPGVYVLSGNSRVVDAIAAAGGATARADLNAVNLATPLIEAAQIYIPRGGETTKPVRVRPKPGLNPPTNLDGSVSNDLITGASTLIDINSASEQQLDTLPGVGPSTARAIVAYRSRHGSFSRIEDLLNVPGIGPAKLDALRSLVRV